MLIQCPNCCKKVSTSSKSCHKCGFLLTEEEIAKKLKRIERENKRESKGKKNKRPLGSFSVYMILVGAILVIFAVFFISNKGFSFYKSKINYRIETGRQTDWIEKCKLIVSSTLKDPDSAQFKDVQLKKLNIDGENLPMVTGFVNAKNYFGGYTGFKRFICGGTVSTTYLESEVDDFQSAWREYR